MKLDGDVPREFMSTAAATWYALDTLHEAFCNQRKKHPGKVAKVKLTDVIETKAGGSTTFTPVFQLAEFVARPPDLPASAPRQASRASRQNLRRPLRRSAATWTTRSLLRGTRARAAVAIGSLVPAKW